MPPLHFARNERPTLGVELELQLVDSQTLELRGAIQPVLSRLPKPLRPYVKSELLQCCVEVNTGICPNVSDVRQDLMRTLTGLQETVEPLGLGLFWAGTHPFSTWRRQELNPSERYAQFVELMQDVVRQIMTFGLHVHIGVESGDKAAMICDRLRRYLPLLLALSANSPFWEGRPTGLHSNRSKILEMLPTAGLPHPLHNWSEFTWLVNHLVDTGFIHSMREIWWDVRPHHLFGTVEVRVCDTPRNLEQVLALTALIQCLVVSLSRQIDDGVRQWEAHPMLVAQNKWLAARHGARAMLIDNDNYLHCSVQQMVDALVDRLLPIGEELGCSRELIACRRLPGSTGAELQLERYAEHFSRRRVVTDLLAESSLPRG